MAGNAIILALFLLFIEKLIQKHEQHGKANEKVLFIVNLSVVVLFNIMTYIFLALAYNNTTELISSQVDLFIIMAISFSVFWIVLGNFMPKLKQNKLIGIRSNATLSSPEVWYKTHRFGGLLMFCLGIATLIISIILENGLISFIYYNNKSYFYCDSDFNLC